MNIFTLKNLHRLRSRFGPISNRENRPNPLCIAPGRIALPDRNPPKTPAPFGTAKVETFLKPRKFIFLFFLMAFLLHIHTAHSEKLQ